MLLDVDPSKHLNLPVHQSVVDELKLYIILLRKNRIKKGRSLDFAQEPA